jgi:hypothetical protein
MKKMRWMVLAVACSALAALLMSGTWAAEPELAGPNLVANGGFEKGMEGWGGPGEVSTEQKAEGEQAARLDGTGSVKVPYVAQEQVPLQPGKYYRVSMSLYRTNGQGYVYVHCNWRDRQGERLMISKTWAMPRGVPMTSRTGEHTGRWSRLSGIIRNQHPDLGGMQLVILQRDGADIVYVDDVRVEEVRYPAAPAWKFPQAVTFPGSPSKMGMKVESAQQAGQKFAISTTGTYWDLDFGTGRITAVQRIGKPRVVFTASLTGLRGPWKITTRTDDVVVVQGPDTALGFQSDSLLTLATNTPITAWVQGQIVPRHFQRLDPYLMAIDEEGGFCAMPYSRPNLSSDGTVLKMREQEMKLPGWGAEYQVGAKEMLGLAVFPGRPFNWEQSFTKRIVNTAGCPSAEELQAYSKYANVLFMFAGVYADHAGGECHAPYTPKDPEQLRRTIKQAHELGMEVILYRHPTSYEWAGQSLDDMFSDMKQWRDKYGFDGWYLDGYPAWTDWFESYVSIRRLRAEIGNKTLYVHCTLNPPAGTTEMYCPFIDSYCDFLLRGEAQIINSPADPYLRYVINTQNISNSIATLKGDQMRVAPGSEQKADLRLQLETMLKLNGRCRWAYPSFPFGPEEQDPYRGFYFPELDRQQAQWEKTRQPLPMRWP